MANECVAANCTTGYATGEKKPSFLFPENAELRSKWIYFVNRKDWVPTKCSVICIDHFEEKFIKRGKSRCKLLWELYPVPTIHPSSSTEPSLQRTPALPRRSPRKRTAMEMDEIQVFTDQER